MTEGNIVGEAGSFEDYQYWAGKADDETVLIGAGDFYTALLNRFYQPKEQPGFKMQLPHLYVCGTAFRDRKEQLKKLDCVSFLQQDINNDWITNTVEIIKKQNKVIMAVDHSATPASELRAAMAKAVKEILKRLPIAEIFIEGGSTAAAVLQELQIKKLEPVNELQRGVVRMRSQGLYITIKPGSYELPEEIKRLYSINHYRSSES